MIDDDDNEVRTRLRQAFPPVDTELRRDLWPAMSRVIESRPLRVVWYDWALAAAAASLLAVFPELILVVVYHL